MKNILCVLMVLGCVSSAANGMESIPQEIGKIEPSKQKIVPLMNWYENELLPVPIPQRVVHSNEEGIYYLNQIENLPRDMIGKVTKWYEYMLFDIIHGDHSPSFHSEDEFYVTLGFLRASINKMSSSDSDSD